MIVTIGGIKGGVGKSLITVNLTVLRALAYKKILLVDADEQQTVSDWNKVRKHLGISTLWTTISLSGVNVRTEVPKLLPNYDDIIIDCGGRDNTSLRAALLVSDIFLVPFQPKCFDVWTIEKVNNLVSEAKMINQKLVTYTFINCAKPRGSDNNEAKKLLSEAKEVSLLPVTIGLRNAFSNATAKGLGVMETKDDSKAMSEISALYNAIFI